MLIPIVVLSRNRLTFDKNPLICEYDIWENKTKLIAKDIINNLVDDIAKTNKPKVHKQNRNFGFRNKNEVGSVNLILRELT